MPKIQEFIKQHLLFLLKISTLSFGIIYILLKIKEATNTIDMFSFSMSSMDLLNISGLLIILSLLNWFGELQKWQILTRLRSSSDLLKQVFVSHALSIFTPNKFGEYGGKCMFYPTEKRHNIIALTGVGHICQMTATLLFGCIGLFSMPLTSIIQLKSADLWILGLSALVLGVFFSLKLIRKHVLLIIENVRLVEQQQFLKTLVWSVFRYLIFSHQFLFLLWCFGAELNYLDGLSIIFVIYFLSSIIPSFALSDVLVKGSLAITLFSFFGIENNSVLVVVFLMWVFNTMLPALVGYGLLMQWKPKFQFIKK